MYQMMICTCGSHCCHNEGVRKRRIYTRNELGHPYSFVRHTCRSCGQWLGDTPVARKKK